ncbi:MULTISPECIES: HAMP domain-containing sensor histidine kinase [Plantibacter]|uniref:histidine kinase n=1 Tax=Plantibacter cousiniae (nom. nud.) TaxID=199709 RepID=A0ABY1LKA1_9MICO|nr:MULTISPECIES: HAMP domain-containing sensor histidine kinase [Plantibacter]MDD9152340.1 HAMP domain-containing sensor histidine kinase [Plantibacter flavus]SKC51032.1 two-component system, OmpR family, sensor kinase [Plantibacter cousiniae]VXB87851.1 Two-component system, OmpR family, sensor kinase [Plantibacter sp. T3]
MADSLSTWWSSVSLRTKITGVTVLVLAFGLLVAGMGTTPLLKEVLTQQANDSLVTAAKGKIVGEISEDGQLQLDAPSTLFVAVYDTNGELRASSGWDDSIAPEHPAHLSANDVAASGTQIYTTTNASGTIVYHAVSVPVTLDGFRTGAAWVAISMQGTDNTIATYLTIFFVLGVLIIVVGALLTRWLVTGTFEPLRQVERTAAAFADGDFSQRLAGSTPNTEVGRLSRSLNTMLARIDRAYSDRGKTIEQMRNFVGDASHELRTPLVSVRGYAELYRMGALQTPQDVAQAMERIEKEAIRMGALVEDLLQLARLDETRPLNVAPVDLLPIARDAALDTTAQAPGRTVQVVRDERMARAVDDDASETTGESPTATDTPAQTGSTGPIFGATFNRFRRRPKPSGDATTPDTKPIAEPLTLAVPPIVLGEENKIRQVVTNLIGNALRFTPADSPIELAVGTDARAGTASIAIVDHGEGIPPQIREKIFQRFWRADSSRTRETGGSGLGLAIVASIVAAHGGTVDVTETPGGGATFRVILPLAPSAATSPIVIAGPPA